LEQLKGCEMLGMDAFGSVKVKGSRSGMEVTPAAMALAKAASMHSGWLIARSLGRLRVCVRVCVCTVIICRP
jgi:hypothetical protein